MNKPKQNGMSDVVKRLQEAGKRIQEGQVAPEDEVPEEDLNQIPFPDSQEFMKIETAEWIEWRWKIDNTLQVIGILYVRDCSWPEVDKAVRAKGTYDVQLAFSEEPSDVFTFTPDMAKTIGHAMISAGKWHEIWREHAGRFIAPDL